MDARNDSSRIVRIVYEWYALSPDITQLWVYEAGEAGFGDARDVHVVVALMPVCDGDDISRIWQAKCTGWQRDLQSLIGRRVHLDCFDADTELAPCAEDAERMRVCLAGIGWRDCPTVLQIQPPGVRDQSASCAPCSACQHEIPLSTAVWREGSDYVAYFWGLDCYDRWHGRPRGP